MKIYVENHNYHYEMDKLTREFLQNEKIETLKTNENTKHEKPCIITRLTDENIFVSLNTQDFSREKTTPLSKDDNERLMAVMLFEILCEYTNNTLPWGISTGVRPVKLFRNLISEFGFEKAIDFLKNELKVTDEKVALTIETEKNEQKILNISKSNSFSLYISIPFCPSRCAYCSFVSQSIEKAKKLIEPYLEKLCEELIYTSKIAKNLNLRLESIYVGGGTPTTLNEFELEKLLYTIHNNFDLTYCKEFTVEAGRPDTITIPKLKAIFRNKVDRISINPQTLNDDILKLIGRNHNTKQTLEAFEMAREVGFTHINTDLIVGLPEDTEKSFKNTLDGIIKLNPESITIHTLAMKKSSKLTKDNRHILRENAITAQNMHTYSNKVLTQNGYMPYYLYRQSKIVGNLENVGWSKKDKEGIYNVFVMDETHTILGCGAGAVTKLKSPSSSHLERVFNFKFPYEYLNDFDIMLKRKESIETFYEKNK